MGQTLMDGMSIVLLGGHKNALERLLHKYF